MQVEYLNVEYPALEGLKEADTQIKYRLPEEIFKKRREVELKKKVSTTVISLCVVAVGLFYFLFNKIELGMVNNQCELAKQTNEQLDKQIKNIR